MDGWLEDKSVFFVLIEALFVELFDDLFRNFGEGVLGIKGKHLPGKVERVIQISALILALRYELMFELLQEVKMVVILLSKRLHAE